MSKDDWDHPLNKAVRLANRFREYFKRGWPTFERAESEMVKHSNYCIDLATFSVELADERAKARSSIWMGGSGGWASGPCRSKSAAELAAQASYDQVRLILRDSTSLLEVMVGASRKPTLAPDTTAA